MYIYYTYILIFNVFINHCLSTLLSLKFLLKTLLLKLKTQTQTLLKKRKKSKTLYTSLKKELDARLFLIEFDGCGKFRLRSYQIP